MAYPRDISIADTIRSYHLPKSHRVHWSKAHKDNVVRAVRDEAISFEEAQRRYLLSHVEFSQWEREYVAAGGNAPAMETV